MADNSVAAPSLIELKNYAPPPYLVDLVDLTFKLDPASTEVKARLSMTRNPAGQGGPLRLEGRKLDLKSINLNGKDLVEGVDYTRDAEALIILAPPPDGRLVLNSLVVIHPDQNSELEGLYVSSNNFCTQCEAQGFRKITYFPDRPDVMARYTVTLIAPTAYPVLLSNGNKIGEGDLGDGTHFARWEDPFPKPSYLFALVAGTLTPTRDSFTTKSGRKVALEIWTVAADADKTDYAMDSLKRSMKWDEDVFGLEYDLDTFMIVAVSDFNMGAMENKGLNVFNTKYVLARPDTATDVDYQGIEAVIAHEYFHNWTGNRVTCRDWFQLSLKEGLTVFRDQEFSADMNSAAVKRISDVRGLRAVQFPEDAGPMAHPVRPSSYIEINNFYTPTVYNKGAEVVRMYHTLLGKDGFRKGMDLYFQRHDGQAVTCDDFRAAMADANGVDLTQFERWYDQAGTPTVEVSQVWDAAAGTLELTITQSSAASPGQADKRPYHIPFALGLIGADGSDLPVRLENEGPRDAGTRVLDLRTASETFRFTGLTARPTPSLLRGFSAPVKLVSDLKAEDFAFLAAHDSDPFARWEAGQTLAAQHLLSLAADYRAGKQLTLAPAVIEAMRLTLTDPALDQAFIALSLALPGESYLAELVQEIDVEALAEVRNFARRTLGAELQKELRAAYKAGKSDAPFAPTAEQAGARALKNAALDLLCAAGDVQALDEAAAQYRAQANMTDVLAALGCLVDTDRRDREEALADFEKRWQHDALVMDKWFTLQALSRRPDTLAQVEKLLSHPNFDAKNPNKLRSLVGAFTSNRQRFHEGDGSGYRFLAEQVVATDKINKQLAARLVLPLGPWRRYDKQRQALMQAALEQIKATPGLSKDVFEIVSKSLG